MRRVEYITKIREKDDHEVILYRTVDRVGLIIIMFILTIYIAFLQFTFLHWSYFFESFSLKSSNSENFVNSFEEVSSLIWIPICLIFIPIFLLFGIWT